VLQSRTIRSVVSGRVMITTPSTPCLLRQEDPAFDPDGGVA